MSSQFWSTVCSMVFGCQYTPKLLDRVVSGACFLTGSVFESDIAHRRTVSVLCVLYKIRCNPMHPLYGALPTCALCASAGYTWCFGGTSVCTLMRFLAAEPHSTAEPLFTCQYLCGTILLSLYSMVWDWQVSRAGPIIFYMV